MANVQVKTRIAGAGQVPRMNYPLPRSWTGAIGILKDKGTDALRYQRSIRSEWARRAKKLEKSTGRRKSRG